MSKRIAYLTYQDMPTGTADDQLTLPLLTAQGVEVMYLIWDDPSVDWQHYDAVIVRSPWDYFRKIPQFRSWLDQIEATGVQPSVAYPLEYGQILSSGTLPGGGASAACHLAATRRAASLTRPHDGTGLG
jgi:hypothetical protein